MKPFVELRRLGFLAEAHGTDDWRYRQMLEQVGSLAMELGLVEFVEDTTRTAKRLSDLSYEDYLRTEEWALARAEALERASHRCQVCNSKEKLNVHHRSYDELPLESLDDLTVLCRNCHEIFHMQKAA